jgi:3-isopropylmalate/(R)-2-methylmalate dehydratase small subunit
VIKSITGKAYVLGANIDTDQIIPAEHLVYSLSDLHEAKKYGQFALSGVPPAGAGLPWGNMPFTENDAWQSPYEIIIAGPNFGCGSSREHAPFALFQAGVKAIIAESYARIFYRNAVDGAFLVPLESHQKINAEINTGNSIEIDLENFQIINHTTGKQYPLKPFGAVLPIVEAGGLFAYARQEKMIG